MNTPPSAAPARLFVYGTLRRGWDHPMQRRLAAAARHLGVARTQGCLYRVAHYPGLVASDDPADQVVGDLYALPDDPALWLELDRYEGCDAGSPSPHEYERVSIRVVPPDGQDTTAWAYLYRWPLSPGQRIFSGDFLQDCTTGVSR